MNVQEVFGIGPTEAPPQKERPSPEPKIYEALSGALEQLKHVQNTEEGGELYGIIFKLIQQYAPNAAKQSAMKAQSQHSQFAVDTAPRRM